MTRTISEAINIPVIASGSAGNSKYFHQAFTEAKVAAVLAVSIFHYGQYSIKETKQYLKNKGVLVRV